jgi:hypothetical protein
VSYDEVLEDKQIMVTVFHVAVLLLRYFYYYVMCYFLAYVFFMYVPFCVIVLFCVLFVCKRVLYCCIV